LLWLSAAGYACLLTTLRLVRPAIYCEWPLAAPRLAAGVIRRRPSGAQPPLR
jgi:hypothetical protein